MAWAMRKDLRGTWRSPNGPVRHIVRDGVRLDYPDVVPVQESARQRQEREFCDGRRVELVPGVTLEQVRRALAGLRVRV